MRNVIVRKPDGAVLATVVLSDVTGGLKLAVDRVIAGKGQLLHHYFGQGLREVLLDSGDFKLNGVLSTRWLDSERRWFVELRPAGVGSGSAVSSGGATNEQ